MARYAYNYYCYFTSLLLLINILELGSAFFVPTRTTATAKTRIASSLLFASSSSDDTKNVVDRDEIGNANAPRPTANNINDHAAVPETTTTVTPGRQKTTRRRKIAILLCPAQFCVPVDYDAFLADVSAHFTKDAEGIMRRSSNNDDDATATVVEIVASRVAPLPRTEWIKVAWQLPTSDFVNGKLSVRRTLDWYFRAIDAGLSGLLADIVASSNAAAAADDRDDVEICIIGHSIGGWVARAYLGGLSSSASTAVYRLLLTRPRRPRRRRENVVKISSLVTLGTPHASSPNAIVDQTRGLLREIETSHSCSAKYLNDESGISITCVGGSGIYCLGGGGGSGSGGGAPAASCATFMENIIATASYLPLLGKVDSTTCGDGIVPYELSYIMDDDDDDGNNSRVRRINIQQCTLTGKSVRHAHVIPTPWNIVNGYAPSYKLSRDDDDGSNVWYGSPGVLRQWIEYI